ncbi:hypothetical protein N431DRAFT_419491 [Stipitochalara longipes BDJ]|nr:hypothetical protein N431DRAFT_419491 [Stipitochalara longipes BDJ]
MSSTDTSHPPPVKSKQPNKRRPHNRTRRGCGNCRLRRVKCDEKRPGCERCQKAHISCTYATGVGQLQSSHEQPITYTLIDSPQLSNNNSVLGLINGALREYNSRSPEINHIFQLNHEGLSLLLRFQNRTVHSIGSQWKIGIWEKEFIRLASLNPYLLHISIACTAMHDRYLSGQGHGKNTELECYHWAMSARLLNHEISQDSGAYDRDAMWMAAVLINYIVFYSVETQNPEEFWPLSPSISEIPWFPIQKGMRAIWQLAAPDRPGSLFSKPANDVQERCLGLAPPKPGKHGIAAPLVELCGLDESSSPETNPYHTAVHALSTLLNNPSANPQSLKFLGFINTIDVGFEALLKEKDPRALLLMSIWYGLVPKSAWWLSLRASLERRAICIYLDRYHADNLRIQRVLASIYAT